jgi:hypothetical protein
MRRVPQAGGPPSENGANGQRQYKQALDAYEAARGDRARAGSGRVLPGEQGEQGEAVQWYRKAADAGRRDG